MIIIKSRGLKERFLTKLKIFQFHRNQSDVRFILAVMKDVPTKQRKEEGGVCIRHGAKRKTCSHEGCTNQAQRGGVCIRHGAKVKQCSHEGCANQVKNGGVCIRHRAKKKTCSHEGCLVGKVADMSPTCRQVVTLSSIYCRHAKSADIRVSCHCRVG